MKAKNWMVTVKYENKGVVKYFECVVKGKNAACKKAQDILWQSKSGVGSLRILDTWIDWETEEEEGIVTI